MSTTLVETVEFKLSVEGAKQQLLEGFKQSNQWLAEKPEFIYRSISHNAETDTWHDIAYWRSVKAAKQAEDEFMTEPKTQLFMQQIDFESVKMSKSLVAGEFYTEDCKDS